MVPNPCHVNPAATGVSDFLGLQIQPPPIDTPMKFVGLETLNYCHVKSTPYQSRAGRLSVSEPGLALLGLALSLPPTAGSGYCSLQCFVQPNSVIGVSWAVFLYL